MVAPICSKHTHISAVFLKRLVVELFSLGCSAFLKRDFKIYVCHEIVRRGSGGSRTQMVVSVFQIVQYELK